MRIGQVGRRQGRQWLGYCGWTVVLWLLASPASAQSVVTVHAQLARIVATPTVSAVQSGNWSDPQTWGGTVPGDRAKIAIPPDITVTVDRVIATAYDWIRVDGTLRFASDVNTQLVAETVVAMGRYEQIANCGVTSKLMFRSLGQPIDHAVDKDPLELTRGLIAMSPVAIQGCAKKEIIAIAGFPAAGATSLTVEQDPVGWQIGDELVVAPTLWGQDETVVVMGIAGRQITFTPALVFTRQNHPDDPAIRVHVGNLTRNVEIRTDPSQAGDPTLQGHVMLMGGGHVIMNAAFRDTGRTLATQPVSDPIILPDGTRDASTGAPLCQDFLLENIRGRYGLHFHNAGPGTAPSTVEGVVMRAPRNKGLKIGIQNHSSYVNIRRVITHQFDGAGVFAEEGDERGEIVDSMMIHSNGRSYPKPEQPGACFGNSYPEKFNRRRIDAGFRGAGIYLHGAGNVLVRGNVIAGHTMAGIDHWTRPLGARRTNTFTVASRPDHLRDGDVWVRLAQSNISAYDPTKPQLAPGEPPLTITDNQIYAIGNAARDGVKAAIQSSGGSLPFPRQYPYRPKNLYARNVLWNTAHCMFVEYTSWVRVEDLTCIGGVQYPGSRQADLSNPGAHYGMNMAAQSGERHEYVNLRIEGFPTAYTFRPADSSTFTNVTIDGVPYVPTVEVCFDGIDNDGNDLVDERCGSDTSMTDVPTPPDPPRPDDFPPPPYPIPATAALALPLTGFDQLVAPDGAVWKLLSPHPDFPGAWRWTRNGVVTGSGYWLAVINGKLYDLGTDNRCYQFTTGWGRLSTAAPCR